VTIAGEEVTRNPAYYVIAHASKFVDEGSVRIESNSIEGLPNVAYQTPSGQKVLIVLNESSTPVAFQVKEGKTQFSTNLNPGATGTWVW
jgi:glucosylceramidase